MGTHVLGRMGTTMVDTTILLRPVKKRKRIYLADGVLCEYCPMTGDCEIGREQGLKARPVSLRGRLLDSFGWRCVALPVFEATLPYASSKMLDSVYREVLWQVFVHLLFRGRRGMTVALKEAEVCSRREVLAWRQGLRVGRFREDDLFFDGP